jgi:hypothetical protein
MKAFSGRLYRPDVAPADDSVPEAERTVEPVNEVGNPVPAMKLVINNPLFESGQKKR